MKVLELEISRLKGTIAAQAGDMDLTAFFFRTAGEEKSYIEDLKQRLKCVFAR